MFVAQAMVMRRSLVLALLLVPTLANAGSFSNWGYMNWGYMNWGYMNWGYMNWGYMNWGYMNGGTIGGFTLSKMKTSQNQPIDNVHLERDYLVGQANVWEYDHLEYWYNVMTGYWEPHPVYAWHYRTISKGEFVGATFEAAVSDAYTDVLANTATIRISSMKTTTGADGETYYQFVTEWLNTQTNVYTPVCGCENGNSPCTPVGATFLQGAWNYTSGNIDGGRKISNDPNLLTVACAQAALAKCGSDQSVRGPTTPSTYLPYSNVPQWTWVHKGSYPVFPGTKITVRMHDGTGDPDLYVTFNEQPDFYNWDCRPYTSGSNETCTLDVPSWAKTVYVSVYGYSASGAYVDVVSASAGRPRGMGYKPWTVYKCLFGVCEISPSDKHQACTRMVVADYCGDGRSFTVNGRPINVYDHYSPERNVDTTLNDPSPTGVWELEGQWSKDGALWVGTCRVGDLQLSATDPNHCPNYNGYVHPINSYTPLYDAYGNEIGCFAGAMDWDAAGYLYNYNTGTFIPPQPKYTQAATMSATMY